MNCSVCGAPLPPGSQFCQSCGAKVEARPQYQAQPYYVNPEPNPQYRLLSPWAYFGLALLFSIPIVGFVFLIVFSFDDSSLNRRNYARSYWCGLVVVLVIIAVTAAILAATGSLAYVLSSL